MGYLKDKLLITVSITVGLFVGFFASIYLPNVHSQPSRITTEAQIKELDDYFKGKTDATLSHMAKQIDIMSKKFDDLCGEVTDLRIKAAEIGGMYGAGASILVYSLGFLGKLLLEKRKRKG